MPLFSVIIPLYNCEKYINRCIDSVLSQTVDSVEAIVVDDCSTDNSLAIAKEIAERDDRVTVVHHDENKGRHAARKTGTTLARGIFSVFLDSDDELSPDLCERALAHMEQSPCDALHFGIEVVGENGLLTTEAEQFERGANSNFGRATGETVMRAVFDKNYGFAQDWRVTQRVYRTDLLKSAFEEMTDRRINRSEDQYETFVILSKASSSDSIDTYKGYVYHYGLGISGTSSMSLSEYAESCKQFHISHLCTKEYAEQLGTQTALDCYHGMVWENLELIANEWLTRLQETDRPAGMEVFSKYFGAENAITQTYRLIRDRAYSFWDNRRLPKLDDPLYSWVSIAHNLEQQGDYSLNSEQEEIVNAAMLHLHELDSVRRVIGESPDRHIALFASTHKKVEKPQASCIQLVQVNAHAIGKDDRFRFTYHDNDGENISRKNSMYCELTTQYWAWKNVDADYYGFCHYRRYFDFSGTHHEENAWGEVEDTYINEGTEAEYGLTDDCIEKAVEGFDVITTGINDISAFPDKSNTPLDQWHNAQQLHDDDLKRVFNIVKTMHPDYAEDVTAFANGHTACFCNMFIMKKDIFFDYCEWLFPILDRFCDETDMSTYSKEALRTPGHLSERLLNIYLIHHKRIGDNWKTKQLQCVHFAAPGKQAVLAPLPSDLTGNRKVIPVVFAADDNYVPMVTTTIYSMLKNASPDYFYDIVIFSNRITYDQKKTMDSFFAQFDFAAIRLFDAKRLADQFTLSTNNPHIGTETYYRFLIQDALPFYKKVVYLDSDLIIQGDIAELYHLDLQDNLLAAAHDIDFCGNLNMPDGKRAQYAERILGMSKPYDYFQAGVLLLNTNELRKVHSSREWLEIAQDAKYLYNDQDILNEFCQGRVQFLDYDWNVMNDCGGRIEAVFTFAPAQMNAAYLESRQHEKITHYAGFEKPWNTRHCDRSELYWAYARKTPFYEDLLARLIENMATAADWDHERDFLHRQGGRKWYRKIADWIAPYGSARRENLKKVLKRLR